MTPAMGKKESTLTFDFAAEALDAEIRCIDLSRNVRHLRHESRVKDRFVSTLAHDLRNPLSSALVNAQLIQRHCPDSPAATRLAGRIEAALSRASDLVEDYLELGRAQADHGRLLFEAEPADIPALINRLISELPPERAGRVRYDGPDSLVEPCNPGILSRVIDNLLQNALKYAEPSTPITIGTEVSAHHLRISVHNEGAVLSAESRRNIFDWYSREEKNARRAPGWGVGLPASKLLIESLDGRIDVHSSEADGTRFTITLPRLTRLRAEKPEERPRFS